METIIKNEEWARFYQLRQRVFDLIEKVDEGYHKSYEGAVEVRLYFANIYESDNVKTIDGIEIELHCYLLINGRHLTWEGRTFAEALNKFENWITHTERIENEDN